MLLCSLRLLRYGIKGYRRMHLCTMGKSSGMEGILCPAEVDHNKIFLPASTFPPSLVYGTFAGTNLNSLWDKFLVPSEDDPIQSQHTSSPLGYGAIVETSDQKIVVLQRSYNVGEFPGHFVFPGGHPGPQEVGAASHQIGEDLTNLEHINNKVSQEMLTV